MELKKKILFIMPTLEGGGAEKVLIDILRHFDFTKYDISLFLIRCEGVHLNEVPEDVEIISLDRITANPPKYIVNRYTMHLWDRYRLKKVLGKRKYDTAISFMEGEALYYHALITDIAKRNISWVHCDLKSFHWSARFFKNFKHEKESYLKMDEIVCVSKHAEKQFRELFGQSISCKVIYNLIDTKRISSLSESGSIPKENCFTICNVGRLCKEKRQDRLIEAIGILKNEYHTEVMLRIIGEGSLMDKLKDQASLLNVGHLVKFMGFQSNPYQYMTASDIFVLSSETEGYAIVVAEAMCLGLPIISTDIPVVEEVLGNQCGIICNSPEDISKAILSLIKCRQLIDTQKKNSENRALFFNPSHTMEQIYSVI